MCRILFARPLPGSGASPQGFNSAATAPRPLQVFVISSEKIQRRNYDTLFKFATSSRRSVFGAIVLRAPPHLRPLIYMLAHVLLTIVTLSLSALWWTSRIANSAFMVAILTASAWSGECQHVC